MQNNVVEGAFETGLDPKTRCCMLGTSISLENTFVGVPRLMTCTTAFMRSILKRTALNTNSSW